MRAPAQMHNRAARTGEVGNPDVVVAIHHHRPRSRETAALERRARISAGWQMCQGRPSDVPLSLSRRRSRPSVLDPNAVMQRSSVPSFFHETRSGYEKSLVCLIRSLRTVTSLSIAAASVLSRRSFSIWFGPAFKNCFIISNVLTDFGHTLRWEIRTGSRNNSPVHQTSTDPTSRGQSIIRQ